MRTTSLSTARNSCVLSTWRISSADGKRICFSSFRADVDTVVATGTCSAETGACPSDVSVVYCKRKRNILWNVRGQDLRRGRQSSPCMASGALRMITLPRSYIYKVQSTKKFTVTAERERERERALSGTTVHNGGSKAAPAARTPHHHTLSCFPAYQR